MPEMAETLNKELILGGLVVDYKTIMGKRGQFGIIKLEDYTGSYEIRLFGQNFIDYGKYGVQGTPIIVRGMYEKRRYGDGVDFNIRSITLLEDIKGKMVHNIRISINDSDLEQMEDLKSLLQKKGDSKADLYFRVRDCANGRHVDLISKRKICLDKQLLDALDAMNVEYKVNV